MSKPAGEFVDRLRRELADVRSWIARLGAEPKPSELETAGDNTPFSEELDAMQLAEASELRAQFLAWLTEREMRLQDALRRVQQGVYGICTQCGRAIARERLAAVPETNLCLECQARVERAERPCGPAAGPGQWVLAEEFYKEHEVAETG
jgi:RNA polymerase-binding transcription factor DksA